ncbi:MAG: hypothetical protein WC479_06190 [Candidatus Izemoplasmatales bacterium]
MTIKASTDLSLRRKEQVFVAGYEIDVAKELTPSLNTTDIVDDIFGTDSPITQTIVDTASLSMTVLEKRNNNKILDVLTGQDPSAASPKEYYCEDVEAVSVWVNKKNAGDTAYERSFFYKDWTPQIPLSAGGPKERSARTLAGLCNKPLEFEGAWIFGEKVSASTAATSLIFSGHMSANPVVVPRSGMYAIQVIACSGTSSSMIKEDVAITTAMVNSTGWVTIANSALTDVKGPTAFYVNYLSTATGIYPDSANIIQEGLYSTSS